jgi:hypothetical protein
MKFLSGLGSSAFPGCPLSAKENEAPFEAKLFAPLHKSPAPHFIDYILMSGQCSCKGLPTASFRIVFISFSSSTSARVQPCERQNFCAPNQDFFYQS